MRRITNFEDLVCNGASEDDKSARKIALKLLEQVLAEADPKNAVYRAVKLNENSLNIQGQTFNLKMFKNIYVVGGGKAGGGMAETLEKLLGRRITQGFVNIPTGTITRYKTSKILLNESTHPVPNTSGVTGTEHMLEIAKTAGEDDLVIVLISGGASALMPLPAEGVTLTDLQQITKALLRSGADIVELNSVRKHLSDVKGGRLAQACYPATTVSLIISDVVGDPVDVIASGPTVPDPTSYADALRVLEKNGLTNENQSITAHLTKGRLGKLSETLKDGDACMPKIHNFLISTNRQVLDAVADEFKDCFDIEIFSTSIVGEARIVGRELGEKLMDEAAKHRAGNFPKVLIGGGETTVTVTGSGRGGRNQELVLSAIAEIRGDGVCIASMGSDGIDGATDAAGAIADGKSQSRCQTQKLSPQAFIARNDSNTVFNKLDDLILTGPTGTNVNDVIVLVISNPSEAQQ